RIALEKISEKDFGSCSRCGRPIATARLMFMPESRKCVRCAE
ncbi:MAG: TraR/DksA C4-type zinc finger protein, partial [Phaeodactylibacter sp.]|nr:TraR/DksA C4-type zinc finger protein [Phaeodactylibacter sp.]